MLESAADPFGEVSEDNFNDDRNSRQADEKILIVACLEETWVFLNFAGHRFLSSILMLTLGFQVVENLAEKVKIA